MTEEQFNSLPDWAQNEIARLQSENAELQRTVYAIAGEGAKPDSPLTWRPPDEILRYPLPVGAELRYRTMRDGREKNREVRFHADHIEVRGNRPLWIQPHGSSAVLIVVGDWR